MPDVDAMEEMNIPKQIQISNFIHQSGHSCTLVRLFKDNLELIPMLFLLICAVLNPISGFSQSLAIHLHNTILAIVPTTQRMVWIPLPRVGEGRPRQQHVR